MQFLLHLFMVGNSSAASAKHMFCLTLQLLLLILDLIPMHIKVLS